MVQQWKHDRSTGGCLIERRKHRRMQVLLAVELKVDAKRELARVLEISAGGLRVEASPTGMRGTGSSSDAAKSR
jgi:hypothetical protein